MVYTHIEREKERERVRFGIGVGWDKMGFAFHCGGSDLFRHYIHVAVFQRRKTVTIAHIYHM